MKSASSFLQRCPENLSNYPDYVLSFDEWTTEMTWSPQSTPNTVEYGHFFCIHANPSQLSLRDGNRLVVRSQLDSVCSRFLDCCPEHPHRAHTVTFCKFVVQHQGSSYAREKSTRPRSELARPDSARRGDWSPSTQTWHRVSICIMLEILLGTCSFDWYKNNLISTN